jgi:hypothetical protein
LNELLSYMPLRKLPLLLERYAPHLLIACQCKAVMDASSRAMLHTTTLILMHCHASLSPNRNSLPAYLRLDKQVLIISLCMCTLLTESTAMRSTANHLGLNIVRRTLTMMFNAAGAMGQSPSPTNDLPASPVSPAPNSPGKPHALQFSSAKLIS